MSAMQREKGAKAEREIAAILRVAGWPNAQRTSDGRAQSARGDIAHGPAGVHVEVKRHEKLNVPKALDQVAADANPLDIPLLIHRPSRHDWMCTMPLDEALALIKFREQST